MEFVRVPSEPNEKRGRPLPSCQVDDVMKKYHATLQDILRLHCRITERLFGGITGFRNSGNIPKSPVIQEVYRRFSGRVTPPGVATRPDGDPI